jgi:N-acetylglucosamine kinase-like BadF-type ATPase
MNAFLGVDGGGTKTALCVISEDGRVLAEHRTASLYHLGPGLADHVTAILQPAVTEVCAAAGVAPADLTYAFLGLAAFGEIPEQVTILEDLPESVLGHRRYRCGNDMICGWAGSLGGTDGINVISGTGSITYGERLGTGVRAGGWGEVFGDEGSGYWLGVHALQAFSRMSDGRQTPGPLLEIVREHLGLGEDLDLIDLVLNQWLTDRSRIAALSRPLVQAARADDPAAAALLDRAADELVLLVETTRRRLGYAMDERVPVSYSGGIFSVDEVREPFVHRLTQTGHDVRRPIFTPVIGAALYAAGLAGRPLLPDALANLGA